MIAGFHHVVLLFRDTEKARIWYTKAGFGYLRGYDGMHWFSAGDGELMLHPAEKSSGGSGLVLHFATTDVHGLFEQAVQQGLHPFDHQQPGDRITGPVTRPWGDIEFELEDPEAHILAFTQS